MQTRLNRGGCWSDSDSSGEGLGKKNAGVCSNPILVLQQRDCPPDQALRTQHSFGSTPSTFSETFYSWPLLSCISPLPLLLKVLKTFPLKTKQTKISYCPSCFFQLPLHLCSSLNRQIFHECLFLLVLFLHTPAPHFHPLQLGS